jgi:hypothetical protein
VIFDAGDWRAKRDAASDEQKRFTLLPATWQNIVRWAECVDALWSHLVISFTAVASRPMGATQCISDIASRSTSAKGHARTCGRDYTNGTTVLDSSQTVKLEIGRPRTCYLGFGPFAGIERPYSITSSARERSAGGKSRPMLLAVFRLTTNSK